MSGWEREAEFRSLLQKVSAKATKDALDTVADIAVRDDKVAYKAVCALLVHEMKALKPSYRLRLFYALSAILRQSKSRRGERDKYAPRFEPLLDQVADLLMVLRDPDKISAVLKVLDIWWRDEIFDASTIAGLQTRFRTLLETTRSSGGGTATAGSSGHGGALQPRASATGTAAAVAPPHAQQHSSPGLLLSSMSPASFSAGGSRGATTAGAAGPGPSLLGQPAAGAAPGPPPSQVSKAAAPAAGESLSTAHVAPLHAVGSSSQLLQQQSTEAYDPLAAAADVFAPAAAAGQAVPSGVLPPLPPPVAGLTAVPAAAYQQQQQQQEAPPPLPDSPLPPSAMAAGQGAGASLALSAAPWQSQPPPPPAPPADAEAASPLPPLPPGATGAQSPPPQDDAMVRAVASGGEEAVGHKRKSRWS